MATPVTLTMDGTLLNWLKKVGDAVNKGDIIAEVEADKATVEIEAPESGVISALNAQLGDSIKAGTDIALIGEGVAEPVPASAAPQPVVKATEPSAPAGAAARSNGAPAPVAASLMDDGRVKASPIARKIAEERGIDLRQVAGSGPGGRIIKEDVEGLTPGAVPARPAAPAMPPAAPSAAPAAAPAASGPVAPAARKMPEGADIEVIELNTMRKRIAQVTVESKQWQPHFYVTAEIDVEPLLALRQQLNAGLSEEQKISVNDLIVKAAALTLRQYPNLNSHFYGDRLARHKRIHIGIAVALPSGGLLNVVAKDADKVALGTLAQQNKEMFARARDGKIKPDDITGATFTVSNLGPYNVEHFLAIINPPEAAILAVGTATKVPVVKADGSLGVGTRMKVTISVDHRVSDGAEGAQFLQAFKALLENPMRLLI
jgi:pyruvate dehydrogenase E2 component (dihydrolipoamide acetyltransferase)